MQRNFIAPLSYVQGANVLETDHGGFEHLQGTSAYLLGGETALELVGDILIGSLEVAGIAMTDVIDGVDACTPQIIDEHTARAADAEIVVGIGGGVAIDVATAVATAANTELVAVPTIASTDAPTSTVAVVYDDDGNFSEVRLRDRNPELVLVDTRVIARAPARFLRHGMGDAIATRFEAEACMRANAEVTAGGRPNRTALHIARHAYAEVEEHGADALVAAEQNAVTPALERVVEANTLLSGLGFESGGTAGAHAIQIGLTNVGVRRPHGELVAFGTLAELVLQDRSAAIIEEVRSLLVELGLDARLADFGVAGEELGRVGKLALEHGMGREPDPHEAADVADAIRTADAFLAP